MKRKDFYRTLLTLFGLCSLCSLALSQVDPQIQRYRADAKGDVQFRKMGVLDGNRVVTLFNNDGEVAYWPFQPSGVWPKGTDHSYLDGYALLIGAKVLAPGNGAIITPIESAYREEVDKDPQTGEEWVFQPVPGYVNPFATSPAISSDRTTYPAIWPDALNLPTEYNGQWYGYFGKGVRANLTESFYVMDDSKDREFTRSPYGYYPVVSDTNRGGLGLRVEVRSMQWSHPLAEDLIFWHYRMTNISDHDYDTTSFGFYIDPGVGGTANSGNSARPDRALNLVYAWTPSGLGVPGNWSAGYLGYGFLETPNDLGLTSVLITVLADKGPTAVWPKNDDIVWGKMNGGFIDTMLDNTNLTIVAATGPFAFPKWASDTVTSVLLFASDLQGLRAKTWISQEIRDHGYQISDSLARIGPLEVHILTPHTGSAVSGTTPITWTTNGNLGKTVAYLFYSRTDTDWVSIGVDSVNSGHFVWNTETVRDGIFYKLQILCVAQNGIGYVETDSMFTVNNPGNVPPDVQLLSPKSGLALNGTVPISWVAGDADGDPTHVNLYYSVSSSTFWNPIIQNLPSTGVPYLWDTKQVANGDLKLRAEAVSGSDTTRADVGAFHVFNERAILSDDRWILQRKSHGTGRMEVHVLDSASVTGDSYVLQFRSLPPSGALGYNVYNQRTGQEVVTAAAVADKYTEGPYFEGLRLVVTSDSVAVIDTATRWTVGTSNLVLSATPDQSVPSRDWQSPSDYEIVWYGSAVDSTVFNLPPRYPKMSLDFVVTNLTENARVLVIVDDRDGSVTLTPDDTIRFIEKYVNQTNFKITWRLAYGRPPGGNPVLPLAGDRFVIRSTKPYASGDSILFSTQRVLPVGDRWNDLPAEPFVLQNYPNPFNPATIIRYGLPHKTMVSLVIYNTLGQQVATLLNGPQEDGYHDVRFDGSGLASGVYFYRLTAGDFVRTKKLLLLH